MSVSSDVLEKIQSILLTFNEYYEIKNIAEYAKAAFQNNADGQYQLGCAYKRIKKFRESLHWFELAARQGLANAQYELGNFFWNYNQKYAIRKIDADGRLRTIQCDPEEAFKWYRLAVDQNHAEACYSLGKMFEHAVFPGLPRVKDLMTEDGIKVELPNTEEATRYYRLAAALGHVGAIEKIKSLEKIDTDADAEEEIEEFEDSTPPTPTIIEMPVESPPEEIKKDNEHPETQPVLLVDNLQEEFGQLKKEISDFLECSQKIKESISFYLGEAELGCVYAQHALGNLYKSHLGSQIVGFRGAYKWFRLAAEKGYPDAQYSLACLYQNYKNEFGEDGWIFYNNELVELPNLQEAFNWFNRAAEAGHMDAHYELGKLYEANALEIGKKLLDDKQTEIELPNLEKARDCYRQAARLGHEGAKAAITKLQATSKHLTEEVFALAFSECLKKVEDIIRDEWAIRGKQWNLSPKEAVSIFLNNIQQAKYEKIILERTNKDDEDDLVIHLSPISVHDIIVAYADTISIYEAAVLLVGEGLLAKEKLAFFKGGSTKSVKIEPALIRQDSTMRSESESRCSFRTGSGLKGKVAKKPSTLACLDNLNAITAEIKQICEENADISPNLTVEMPPLESVCSSEQTEVKPSIEASQLEQLQALQESQALQLAGAAKEIEKLQHILSLKEIERQQQALTAIREQANLEARIISLQAAIDQKDTQIMLLQQEIAAFKEPAKKTQEVEVFESLAVPKVPQSSYTVRGNSVSPTKERGNPMSPTKRRKADEEQIPVQAKNESPIKRYRMGTGFEKVPTPIGLYLPQ